MTYNATVNKKVITWIRHNITFEARNEEHATQLIEDGGGVPDGANFNSSETLYEAEESFIGKNGKPVYIIEDLERD